MANPTPKEKVEETLSFIDAIIACVENFPTLNFQIPFLDEGMSINAMVLLMMLLRKFCTEEEIIQWIAKFLIYSLPVIELGVKGLILSNLKLDISCNIDPWIPDDWRQHNFDITQDNGVSNLEDGCMIPIASIDYRNMLQKSPFTGRGKDLYFGTKLEFATQIDDEILFSGDTRGEVYEWIEKYKLEHAPSYIADSLTPEDIISTGDINTQYDLARADDMNAFLWFVMNKGIYNTVYRCDLSSSTSTATTISAATKVVEITQFDTEVGSFYNNNYIYDIGDVVSTIEDAAQENKGLSTNYLLCYDSESETLYGENNDPYDYSKSPTRNINYYAKLVPCSNRYNSFNWYVNRENYFKRNIGNPLNKYKNDERNYEEEFPLFNLKCVGHDGQMTNRPTTNSYLKILALPRPLIHYDYWWMNELTNLGSDIIIPYPFTKVIFDADGKSGKKVKNKNFTVQPVLQGKKIRKPLKICNSNYIEVMGKGTISGSTAISNKEDVWTYFYQLQDINDNGTDFYLSINKNSYDIIYVSGGTNSFTRVQSSNGEKRHTLETNATSFKIDDIENEPTVTGGTCTIKKDGHESITLYDFLLEDGSYKIILADDNKIEITSDENNNPCYVENNVKIPIVYKTVKFTVPTELKDNSLSLNGKKFDVEKNVGENNVEEKKVTVKGVSNVVNKEYIVNGDSIDLEYDCEINKGSFFNPDDTIIIYDSALSDEVEKIDNVLYFIGMEAYEDTSNNNGNLGVGQNAFNNLTQRFINTCLFPCYNGLTVYEWNYDFVMGMRLFEPVTIAKRIFNALMDFYVDLPPLTTSEQLYQTYIEGVIENLMFDDEEVSDCFFSFSNDKFASMLQDAEIKRSKKYPFEDDEHSVTIDSQSVLDILNQFDGTASLEEQKDIIAGAFSQIGGAIHSSVDGKDKIDISFNFILESLKILGLALLECLISPKMLLLFTVNQRLMGQTEEKYPDFEKLMKQLGSLIVSIIKNIAEQIITELLAFVMRKIGELLAKLAAMVSLEQLNNYKKLIMKLIEACKISWDIDKGYLDTTLDSVKYADITETERPQTEDC